jgi:hypothetical protein
MFPDAAIVASSDLWLRWGAPTRDDAHAHREKISDEVYKRGYGCSLRTRSEVSGYGKLGWRDEKVNVYGDV